MLNKWPQLDLPRQQKILRFAAGTLTGTVRPHGWLDEGAVVGMAVLAAELAYDSSLHWHIMQNAMLSMWHGSRVSLLRRVLARLLSSSDRPATACRERAQLCIDCVELSDINALTEQLYAVRVLVLFGYSSIVQLNFGRKQRRLKRRVTCSVMCCPTCLSSKFSDDCIQHRDYLLICTQATNKWAYCEPLSVLPVKCPRALPGRPSKYN